MMKAIAGILASAVAIGLAAMYWPDSRPTGPADGASAAEKSRFDAELLAIAQEYPSWGRVDESSRWAPLACRMPTPATARFSHSDDESTHGQKLYNLFARQRSDYLRLTDGEATSPAQFAAADRAINSPDGKQEQAVVKESWTVKPADGNSRNIVNEGDRVYSPNAQRAGKWYETDQKAGLFIMFRAALDAAGHYAPDTDDGWVYGTVTPDGKTVTAAGRVQSCMHCHQQAPHGRLFGLAKDDR
jgi:hypothetical protein